jgi:hypothetical protein
MADETTHTINVQHNLDEYAKLLDSINAAWDKHNEKLGKANSNLSKLYYKMNQFSGLAGQSSFGGSAGGGSGSGPTKPSNDQKTFERESIKHFREFPKYVKGITTLSSELGLMSRGIGGLARLLTGGGVGPLIAAPAALTGLVLEKAGAYRDRASQAAALGVGAYSKAAWDNIMKMYTGEGGAQQLFGGLVQQQTTIGGPAYLRLALGRYGVKQTGQEDQQTQAENVLRAERTMAETVKPELWQKYIETLKVGNVFDINTMMRFRSQKTSASELEKAIQEERALGKDNLTDKEAKDLEALDKAWKSALINIDKNITWLVAHTVGNILEGPPKGPDGKFFKPDPLNPKNWGPPKDDHQAVPIPWKDILPEWLGGKSSSIDVPKQEKVADNIQDMRDAIVKAANAPSADASAVSFMTGSAGGGFMIPGSGSGGNGGIGRRSRGGGGGGGGDVGGSPYSTPASGGKGALTGLITDTANDIAKQYNVDATWLADTMEGIRAGESGHRSTYDKVDDWRESSWGPFQLNRRRGLGVQFEKETGLDVRDPKTIPDQARWVAKHIASGKGTADWMGFHGRRKADPRWGDSGYNPAPSTTSGGYLSRSFGKDSAAGGDGSFFAERNKQNLDYADLNSDFAASLKKATTDAEAITGEKAEFTSLARTREKQAELYYNYKHHIGGQGLAAPPGTSLHEKGMAADLAAGKVRDYIRANAPKYGMELVPGDPEHVQMSGANRMAAGQQHLGNLKSFQLESGMHIKISNPAGASVAMQSKMLGSIKGSFA